MLNNGSSESDDSEIEAICRRTRGHEKAVAIELETKKKNAIDKSETTNDSRKVEMSEDENDNEKVLLPTGDWCWLDSLEPINAIEVDGNCETHFRHFSDPSEWTASNIDSWLAWTTKKFNIEPAPMIARFPTTGAELVKMSRAEFWVCAGSKNGGNTLSMHIAHLIHSATGRCTSPMLNDNDPGKLQRAI